MNALVIGFGSIGSRHARILDELGCNVAVMSRRDVAAFPCFSRLDAALDEHRPEYVVIANATSVHHEVLTQLAGHGYSGRVLVEKPLFDEVLSPPPNRFDSIYVGYNLRFHPLLCLVRDLLSDRRVLSVDVRVGQYLPLWRTADYRNCYSARRAEGGGVLRDLSHELDYVRWLFGPWQRLTALGGHVSDLEIDSDDVFALLVVAERCPVISLQLDYLDRDGRREISIQTDRETIRLDLLHGTLRAGEIVETSETDRDATYRRQHETVLAGRDGNLCTVDEGIEAIRMILAAETAARERRWVEN